jgi:hypothetical protein
MVDSFLVMKNSVCIISIEHFNRNYPLSGGALRVLGLRYLLQKLGFTVILLRPASEIPPADEKIFYPDELAGALEKISPDVIIVEQWALLDILPETEVPVICDLHGSLYAENWYKGYREGRQGISKCHALSRADGFFVPGDRQYYYFRAWLAMAGFDIDENTIIKVPLVLDPAFYAGHNTERRKELVCGGVRWPWAQIMWSAEQEAYFAEQGFDILRFLHGGGADQDGQLKKSTESETGMAKSHCELVNVYQFAFAAWDFYQLNRERELAITTRTMEYLYCGLPVFYPQSLELAELINRFDMGFTAMDPQGFRQIDGLVDEIERKRENIATFLQSDDWYASSLAGLAAFPALLGQKKQGFSAFFVESEQEIRRLVRRVGELEKKLSVSEQTRKIELEAEVGKNAQAQKALNEFWEGELAQLKSDFALQNTAKGEAHQSELKELGEFWGNELAKLRSDFEQQNNEKDEAHQKELKKLGEFWEGEISRLRIFWETEGENLRKQLNVLTRLWQQDSRSAALSRIKKAEIKK